jgi:hypothetical protein
MADVLRLRIESGDGLTINDYRVHDGKLQFRLLDQSGSPVPGVHSEWQELSAVEISKHTALKTVVAEWLALRGSQV